MATTKIKVGEWNCPVCGSGTKWRQAESGSLSCFCQECDFNGFAKHGTDAKRRIIEKFGFKTEAAPVADPAPAPEKKEAPKPEKTSAFGVFGL